MRVLDVWDVLLDYSLTVLGPQQGQDNNNQQQPYSVALATGGYNVTADFGYWQPSVRARSETWCGTMRTTTACRTWASRGCRTCGWICI